MEAGLYVTFFDGGEAPERELPPVGPLEHVVLRHRELVAERRAVTETPDTGVDVARWLEAELELQRATGEEPGGPKRAEMRILARDGVYVRFAVFGDVRERDAVAELGPYAVVVIGRRGVEADGQLLATRSSSDLAAWELTTHAGIEAAGRHKPDIAFRTPTVPYHPQIATAPAQRGPAVAPATLPGAPPPPIVPVPTESAFELPPSPRAQETEPLFRPATPHDREIYTPPAYTPPAEEPSALTEADLALIQRIEQQRAEETLRARIQEEERRRLGVDDSEDEASTWAIRYRTQPAQAEAPATAEAAGGGFTLGPLLWRLRFAIIGVLLLGVGAYGFTLVRSGGASNVPGQPPQVKFVGIAQKVSSARWDYIVNGVQRATSAGTAAPRGVYYVVRVGITNRGTDGAQLSPGEFVLIDATGTEHRAEPATGAPYYSPSNTQSQFIWPQSFPVGRAATVSVIFDVDPGLGRGMQLAISDLPATRVKLD
ncbi:MAG TPA: hypothetical protein VFV20_09640 [Candidatus Limnocylindria bacterium]|nr:hypothetical protein [Candidatus Limnocylindria bacterium]